MQYNELDLRINELFRKAGVPEARIGSSLESCGLLESLEILVQRSLILADIESRISEAPWHE